MQRRKAKRKEKTQDQDDDKEDEEEEENETKDGNRSVTNSEDGVEETKLSTIELLYGR